MSALHRAYPNEDFIDHTCTYRKACMFSSLCTTLYNYLSLLLQPLLLINQLVDKTKHLNRNYTFISTNTCIHDTKAIYKRLYDD